MKNTDLTIYVLAHNRPETLLEVMESLKEQTFKRFKVVVSDNSSDYRVREMLKNEGLMGMVEYRYRNESQDHFNLILSEINTPYFMMLHDDDLFAPTLVGELYERIKAGNYSAVACNGYKFWESLDNKFGKMIATDEDVVISNADDAFFYYFEGGGVAPFPSYMYNAKLIKNLHIEYLAGNYSDAVWLTELTKYGSLYWIGEPLFYYRKHEGQGSSQKNGRARSLLLKYFYKNVEDEALKTKILKLRIVELKSRFFIASGLRSIKEKYLAKRAYRFSEKYDKIYIYGCGDVGRRCKDNLKDNNIRIEAFLVSDNKNLAEMIYGYPVLKYDKSNVRRENAGIILAVGKDLQSIILQDENVSCNKDRILIYSKTEQ